MATALPNFTKDAPVVNYLTGTFFFVGDGSTTTTITKTIGVLPRGAIVNPLMCMAAVEEAFDGTTPVTIVGITGTTNALWASADITEGTTGQYPGVAASFKSGGFHVPLAADTPIIITYTVGGSPTAGKLRVTIPFTMSALPLGY